MRNTILIAGIHESRDRVIDIFLNRIIHATFTAGRTGTVIINSQSASNIDKLHIKAHRMKLYIKLRRLTQCRLNTTDFSNLASDMEMDQLQALFHLLLFQKIQCFKQFTGSQPELTGVAARIFPLTTSGRSQLDTNTDIGHYIQLLRHLSDKFQFIHLLYDEKNTFSHLLSQ